MNKYRVTVDGTSYEVEIEVIGAGTSSYVPSHNIKNQVRNHESKAKTVPMPQTPSKDISPSKKPSEKSDKDVLAPMQGKILSIPVKEGQEIEKGQVVAVLEAMKMENEIVAHEGGRVEKIMVASGQSVEANDCIVALS